MQIIVDSVKLVSLKTALIVQCINFITNTEKVRFMGAFICLSVCLSVCVHNYSIINEQHFHDVIFMWVRPHQRNC